MAIHALLKKTLALGAGLGVAEIPLTGHTIFTDAHNVHVAILQLRSVAKLLDAIPLCMNRVLAIAATAAATANTIRRYAQNPPTMYQHRQMKACAVCLPQATCVGILQKTIEQGIVPVASGLNISRHDVH